MSDEFRMEQKKLCPSGAPNKMGPYGCPCCRLFQNPNRQKKYARKLAKVRFKQKFKKMKGELINGG